MDERAKAYIDQLMDRFNFDLINGRVFWKKAKANFQGKEAGCVKYSRGKPYCLIKINNYPWMRAHLIFLAVHGRLPIPTVDHVDGNSLNDRPDNLREATRLEQARNKKRNKKTTELPMGVRLNGKNYQARLRVNGKLLILGTFTTSDEAFAAYKTARKQFFGNFA